MPWGACQLADQLFIDHKVHVNFQAEYQRPGSPYMVIRCRCRKKDAEEFESALTEFPNKMLVMGYKDYPDVWKELGASLERRAEGQET